MSEYQKFIKRWNIQSSEEESFEYFRRGVLNSITKYLRLKWDPKSDERFCERCFIHQIPIPIFYFSQCSVYNKLKYEKPPIFFYYLETLLDLLNTDYYLEYYNFIYDDLQKLLKEIPLGLELKNKKKARFYKKGAKLLDQKLVDDVLDWLEEYPNAKQSFNNALEKYSKKIYDRNVADDLRHSLEIFLKQFLGNNKSLEKQQEDLFKFLESKKVPEKIKSMFWTLLNLYSQYQNEEIKHNLKNNSNELEFIIYLTGSFIRYLICLKNNENNS